MERIGAILGRTLCCLFVAATCLAQASVNPDISVIPRFLVVSNDGQKLSAGIREFSRPDLQFQELELAVSSYLNPFAKADVILTLPGPDVEHSSLGVEEVYASIVRGLPLDLNLRIGKYRAEFGKLNLVHPHAWPFISQPLSQQRFLGEEGINDLGISASVLLPTGDLYSKLTVDLLRGKSVSSTAGLQDTTRASPLYATSARLMAFVPVGDESDLETGLSLYTGIHDPYNRERFWYLNADVKYKWRHSAYTSLVIQGEYLFNTRKAELGPGLVPLVDATRRNERRSIETGGAYLYADYQFFKMFSVGGRFDWSQSPYNADDRAIGGALFFGYYPVEETLGLRFEYQHVRTETPGVQQSMNTLALQVLFSLGPHKAHPF